MLKSRQLETELDVTSERLSIATLQLEEKEKQLAATELEMNALTRLVALVVSKETRLEYFYLI